MISLDLKTSWANSLTLVRASMTEAISECYELVVDALTSDASLTMTDALGQPAAVTITHGDQHRRVPGVVTEMALMGILPGDQYWFRLVLVPRLQLLRLTKRSRVFCTEQSQTGPELLQQVIRSADGVTIPASDTDFNMRTTTYPPIDMAVQYSETDLNFLARWAEHLGIFWWFDVAHEIERMVFGDANACFPYLHGSADDSVLSYRPSIGVADTGPAIRSMQAAVRLTPRVAQLNTRDWTDPGRVLLVTSEPRPTGLGHSEWDEEDAYTDAGWGRTLATIRAEEQAASTNEVGGQSDCLALRAGAVFAMRGHDAASLNIRFVVTSVSHKVWESAAGVEFLPEKTPTAAGYGNRFTAIPLSVPFRPRRKTAMPRISGILRAVVDGVSSARSEIDELGCYRIILPFDRTERPPGKSSNRIRLVTPYGGSAEGFHFPLRPGTQVMVAFVKGNPDWPVIVGPLYDASQKSVVTRDNRYGNVIRTASGITMKFYDGPPPSSS